MGSAVLLTLAGACIEIGTGAIFLIAAAQKGIKPDRVLTALDELRVPQRHVAYIALISFEVLLGVALFAGFRLQFVLPVAATTIFVFTAAIRVLRSRKHGGGCGCFGGLDKGLVWISPESRNGILMILIGMAAVLRIEVGWSSAAVRLPASLLLATVVVIASIASEKTRTHDLAKTWRL